MRSTAVLLLLFSSALAQSKATVTTQTVPANWYGAGGAYNFTVPAGVSPASGWAAYAHLLSATAQTYSFTAYNAFLSKTPDGKHQLVTSTSTGAMIVLRQIGPFSLLAFGTVGIASGESIGNAFPYGGILDWHVGSTEWHFDAGIQQIPSSAANVPTQKSVIMGFGRTF